ncbi:MAG: cytochrome b/b6 domain-containing protein [Phycisphaerales bacterium]
MDRVLIWDLPTRISHWLVAGGFVAAATISLVLGKDSPFFPYHAILGLAIVLIVCLRIIWGVVGTRYARFVTFIYGPGAVAEYTKGVFVGGGKRYIGHNPGSAVAIFALLALLLAMGITGVMMGQGNESAKDLHEILAWITVAVAVAHVLGVLLHSIRHRENITASMIHGKKHAEPSDAIPSARPIIAAILLVIAAAWTVALFRNYNPAAQTTTLPIIGTMLHLGENDVAGEKDSGGDRGEMDADDD